MQKRVEAVSLLVFLMNGQHSLSTVILLQISKWRDAQKGQENIRTALALALGDFIQELLHPRARRIVQ